VTATRFPGGGARDAAPAAKNQYNAHWQLHLAGYSMKYLVFVALGGAAGSVSRYLLSQWTQAQWQGGFPLGTLLVNLLGSCAIGVVFALLEKQVLHPDWRGLLMVGFLGAFTTFSTFSLEAFALWESGQALQALGYVLASVTFCFLGAGLAITLTRALL
jgi:CrcB protein